jgi:hypothetical protein
MFPKKSVANTKNNTTQQTPNQSNPPRPTGPKRCSLCALRKK